MANDSLGSIITQGNFLRIDNAFVDEVSSSGRNTGFIIISYSVPWQSGVTTVQQLRLNVNNNTAIMNLSECQSVSVISARECGWM